MRGWLIIFYLSMMGGTAQNPSEIDLEMAMNVTQEIEFNGYHAKNYKVETEDGYFIQIQRIPYGKSGPSTEPSQPILLMHGLAGESSLFIERLNDSLGLQFADNGFDVWLGNMRGNRYALEHKTLTPSDPLFWNFTCDDIASKDLPAMMGFILNLTKAEKIFYAGVSLGNTVGMMLLSSKPEWNDKIKGFAGILPVSRMTYSTSRPNKLLSLLTVLLSLFPDEWISKQIFKSGPSENSTTAAGSSCPPVICNIIFAIIYNALLSSGPAGYDPATAGVTFARTTLYSFHKGSGTSLKVIIQILQLVASSEVTYYNYGPFRNFWKYGAINAPVYNMKKISAPVSLFTAVNDPLADPLDIACLLRDLPNVHSFYVIPYLMFSHDDINFGLTKDLKIMYSAIIKAVKEMQNT